jgi:cytoskeletal protein RodZ
LALFKSWKGAAHSSDGDGDPEIGYSEDTIGRILRRAREERGYDLQQVSQVLRIRYVYLDSIEKGRFDRLPGPAYATGFLRTYADFLDLDPDAVVEVYRRGSDSSSSDSALYFPAPKAEAQIPRGALFAVAALVAVLAYAGWQYLSEPRSDGVDLVPPLPDRLAALVGTGEEKGDGGEDTAAVALPESPATALGEEAPQVSEVAEAVEETAAVRPSEPEAPHLSDEPAVEDAGAPDQAITEVSVVSVGEETAPVTNETEAPEISAAEDASAPSPDSATLGTLEDLPRSPPQPQPLPELLPSRELPEVIESEIEDALPETALAAPETEAQTGPVPDIPGAPERTDQLAGIPEPTPTVYGAENESSRVTLQASQDSWVQVRNAEGELLLTRVLRPGDSYRVPDREGLTLLTGNAGGLEVFVDGRKLPALGPIGAVRRNVDLRPDALLALSSGVE